MSEGVVEVMLLPCFDLSHCSVLTSSPITISISSLCVATQHKAMYCSVFAHLISAEMRGPRLVERGFHLCCRVRYALQCSGGTRLYMRLCAAFHCSESCTSHCYSNVAQVPSDLAVVYRAWSWFNELNLRLA